MCDVIFERVYWTKYRNVFLYYKVTTICCLVTFNETLNTCTEPFLHHTGDIFIPNYCKTEPVSTNHRNKSFVIFHQSCATILLFLALFRYDAMYICNFPLRRWLNRTASKLPRGKDNFTSEEGELPWFLSSDEMLKIH
jgi:hypothetical protein